MLVFLPLPPFRCGVHTVDRSGWVWTSVGSGLPGNRGVGMSCQYLVPKHATCQALFAAPQALSSPQVGLSPPASIAPKERTRQRQD